MKTFSQTIKHVVKNLISMMGVCVFTYNTITPEGVLNCEEKGCEDEECECGEDCEEDCKK